MRFIDRKCLLLFLIFSGGMQTIIVNAEEVTCLLDSSNFIMDGDKIAGQAAQCAEQAEIGFQALKKIVDEFDKLYADILKSSDAKSFLDEFDKSYADILKSSNVKFFDAPAELSDFNDIFQAFLNYAFRKEHTHLLTTHAKMTIKANELFTYAINAGASQEKLSNAEKELNVARLEMDGLLSPFLESDNKEDCKWAMDLLKELFEVDKNACESKRGRRSRRSHRRRGG